jgi:hypothetical protein
MRSFAFLLILPQLLTAKDIQLQLAYPSCYYCMPLRDNVYRTGQWSQWNEWSLCIDNFGS